MGFYLDCRSVCAEDEPLLNTIETIQKCIIATAQDHLGGRFVDTCKGCSAHIIVGETMEYRILLQTYPFMVTPRVEPSDAYIG
jgi:hypothetical protein